VRRGDMRNGVVTLGVENRYLFWSRASRTGGMGLMQSVTLPATCKRTRVAFKSPRRVRREDSQSRERMSRFPLECAFISRESSARCSYWILKVALLLRVHAGSRSPRDARVCHYIANTDAAFPFPWVPSVPAKSNCAFKNE